MALDNFNILFYSIIFWVSIFGISNTIEYFLRGSYLGYKSISNLGAAVLNGLIVIGASTVLLNGFQPGVATPTNIHQFFLFEIIFFACHTFAVFIKEPKKDELLHHSIAILVLGSVLASGKAGYEVLLLLLLGECTFCFYLHAIFKSLHQYKAAHIAFELFNFTFVFIRLLIITPLIIIFLIFSQLPLTLYVGAVLFTVLNLFWAYKLVRPKHKKVSRQMTHPAMGYEITLYKDLASQKMLNTRAFSNPARR